MIFNVENGCPKTRTQVFETTPDIEFRIRVVSRSECGSGVSMAALTSMYMYMYLHHRTTRLEL